MILNFKSIKEQWQYYGHHYGYPQCCIDSFCNQVTTRNQRNIGKNSGFIPCKKHCQLISSGAITLESLIRRPSSVEIH